MSAAEFERQVGNLVGRGYPQGAGLSAGEFERLLEPLADGLIGDVAVGEADASGPVPFAIVMTSELVRADVAIERVERRGKPAILSMMDAEDLARFEPIESVKLPSGSAYLITDVDTGAQTLDVRPNDALKTIEAAGRSPLTIEEGIALVTQHPETVAVNGGFSLCGSRCGDKRVTAIWISKGAPKLGWCWAGNPHTWLGSASCGGRVGGAPNPKGEKEWRT